jgi:hypothetical protein
MALNRADSPVAEDVGLCDPTAVPTASTGRTLPNQQSGGGVEPSHSPGTGSTTSEELRRFDSARGRSDDDDTDRLFSDAFLCVDDWDCDMIAMWSDTLPLSKQTLRAFKAQVAEGNVTGKDLATTDAAGETLRRTFLDAERWELEMVLDELEAVRTIHDMQRSCMAQRSLCSSVEETEPFDDLFSETLRKNQERLSLTRAKLASRSRAESVFGNRMNAVMEELEAMFDEDSALSLTKRKGSSLPTSSIAAATGDATRRSSCASMHSRVCGKQHMGWGENLALHDAPPVPESPELAVGSMDSDVEDDEDICEMLEEYNTDDYGDIFSETKTFAGSATPQSAGKQRSSGAFAALAHDNSSHEISPEEMMERIRAAARRSSRV